jgi:peroxiredoxin
MGSLPAFLLEDARGGQHRFPAEGRVLVCFVKEDCPTCNEVMPLLEAFHRTFGARIALLVPGQTREGNAILAERHGLTVPLLDDSALEASFAWDVEIVPTLYLADGNGREEARLTGFVREEWRALAERLAAELGVAVPEVDWARLPEWRPGCGSRSADPLVAERLRAEAENTPLRARRIEIARTGRRVRVHVRSGLRRRPAAGAADTGTGDAHACPEPGAIRRSVVAVVPPNMGEATVEKIAINAVMAGCRPEYLPVVMAAMEAICTDAYNIHGVMATTMGASPVLVVNGPARHRIGMNMKLGALGQGNRANATIGRAVRLAVRNIGGAKPGGTERSTLGNPDEVHHVLRRVGGAQSVAAAARGARLPSGGLGRDGVHDVERAGAHGGPGFAQCAAARRLVRALSRVRIPPEVALRDGRADRDLPEHVDTLFRDGYTKADIRARIQEVTARPIRELVEDGTSAVGFKARRREGMSAERSSGGCRSSAGRRTFTSSWPGPEAGKFSGAFHGWAIG